LGQQHAVAGFIAIMAVMSLMDAIYFWRGQVPPRWAASRGVRSRALRPGWRSGAPWVVMACGVSLVAVSMYQRGSGVYTTGIGMLGVGLLLGGGLLAYLNWRAAGTPE